MVQHEEKKRAELIRVRATVGRGASSHYRRRALLTRISWRATIEASLVSNASGQSVNRTRDDVSARRTRHTAESLDDVFLECSSFEIERTPPEKRRWQYQISNY